MATEESKVEAIVLAALEKKSPEDLTAFLDEACADDTSLRQRVEALLSARPKLGDFLNGHAADLVATADQPITERPGKIIGRYKLLEQIGEGSFGVVFMAEQAEPVHRKVALKIIKPGMDTREVIARFEAERQALAIMDHPNIAKVLDAGATESGRPFFVMELVRGVPITTFCDQYNLPTRERLELFATVCQAVQHAHQKGIIHRDIKPSNVLVTLRDDRPVAKVIDFGVAKATNQRLTEKTVFTRFAQMIGTPLYMSPEQAGMSELDVDTRSDIYSLGVLLYELLTGTTPFDQRRLRDAAYDELLRIIREEEPPRPSLRISTLGDTLPSVAAHRKAEPRKLSAIFRGELDWIVMKALEKDRTRRYETATGFANDIQRYLDDKAVAACPPSAAYRFRKFARRNKGALVTGAVIAAALLLGIVGTTGQAIRATAAEKLARQRLTAEQAASKEADLAWQAETRQRTVVEQERDRAEKNLERANTEQQRAEGNLDLALDALDAVLDAIGKEKLLGEPVAKPVEEETQLIKPTPLTDLERKLLKRGLDFYDQFARKNADASRASVQTADAYYRVGLIQGALGNAAAAAEAYRGAIERFERLAEEEPDNAEHFRRLGWAYRGLANVIRQWDESKVALEDARRAYSRAIELEPDDITLYLFRGETSRLLCDEKCVEDSEKALQIDPDNVTVLLGCARNHLVMDTWRNLKKEREYCERAVSLEPLNFQCHLSLAFALLHSEDGAVAAQALEHFSLAVELAPTSPAVYGARSAYYRTMGDNRRALADVNRAMELSPNDHSLLFNRAELLSDMGEFDKALAEYATYLQFQPHDAYGHVRNAANHVRMENWQAAAASYTKCVQIQPGNFAVLKRRAAVYVRLGEYALALADLRRAAGKGGVGGGSSALWWISASQLASAPEDFRESLLELADEVVEGASGSRAGALQSRALLYLKLNQWEKSQADFDAAIASGDATCFSHYQHALSCLVLQEPAKYRDTCAAMVKKFAETDDPMTANWVAWTCILIPDALADYEPVLECASKAVEARPESDRNINSLGAVLYRAGHHEKAIEWLTELDRPLKSLAPVANSSPAYTWYFLAMAHHKAGRADQAREYANKANQWTDDMLADQDDPLRWNRLATLDLLRKEAESLLAEPAAGHERSDQANSQRSDETTLSATGLLR